MGSISRHFRRSTPYCGILLLGFLGFSAETAFASDDCQTAPTSGIDWQNCDKTMLMLSESDLSGAKLAGSDFSSTDLRSSNLTGANLEKATLVRANLSATTAKGAHFAKVEAYRTDFSQIDAPGADFQNAELQRSNFKQAKLANADFTKADMGRSQFDGADVSGSRFTLANVSRVDFRGAKFGAPVDFDRAFFFLTRIEGVNLGKATGLGQWQLDMACGDDKTVLPASLTKPKSWPCQFQQE